MPKLLLTVFPTFAVGGAQARFTTLANHLGAEWRHVIVAMDGVTTARERLSPGLDVTFPPLTVRKGDLLGNVRRFRAMMRSLSPTTLLTHNFGSIEWAMASQGLPVRPIHVEDGFGPEERTQQLPRRVWLRRLFLRNRPVVLPSLTLMQVARQTWRLPPRCLHYVPNGVDLERFSRPLPRHEWAGEGPVIGTIAALRPEKNIERLVRAFARVAAQRPARLVLIGDGPQRAELEGLAGELGLGDRVIFAGHTAEPDLLLKSLDIFAMSSDTEQMPISLLEAMAAGRPVAATAVGDIATMLPDVGRRFVTPCDASALAQALLELVGDPALRRQLGDANQAKARQEFGLTDMLARWSSLLQGETGIRKAA